MTLAEIHPLERRILVGQHIGLDIAKGGLGPVVDGVVEGLDDFFLEMVRARMPLHDGFALGLGELGKSNAKHVHFDTGADERDDRMHALRDARRRVQRDRGPHFLDVALGDAVAAKEVASKVGAVDFEAVVRAGMRRGEAHVMKHRAGVKELGVEAEAAALAGKRTPIIDAARMMKEQRRLGVLDQLSHLPRQFAVGDDRTRDRFFTHSRPPNLSSSAARRFSKVRPRDRAPMAFAESSRICRA